MKQVGSIIYTIKAEACICSAFLLIIVDLNDIFSETARQHDEMTVTVRQLLEQLRSDPEATLEDSKFACIYQYSLVASAPPAVKQEIISIIKQYLDSQIDK